MFRVVLDSDSVSLRDGEDELVMWDQQEWVEDPALVLNIVNAVQIGYTEGADGVRRILSQA